MTWFLRATIFTLLTLVLEGPAFGQATTGECPSAALSSFNPLSKTDKCFLIDTRNSNTQGLRQATVVSGDRVFVAVQRRPTEKCTVSTKVEALPPETSSLGGFIGTLAKLVVPAAAFVPPPDDCQAQADLPQNTAGLPMPKPAEVTSLEGQMAALQRLIVDLNERIRSERQTYRDTAKVVAKFQDCKGINDEDQCTSQNVFETAQAGVVANIENALNSPIPTTVAVDLQVQKVQDGLKQITNPGWFANKANQLSCYAAKIAASKAVLGDLATGRQQFAKVIDTVRSMTWQSAPKVQLIPPQKNAKATATLSCSNVISGEPTLDAVSVIVTYKDIPRMSTSVGVLVTLTKKQVIGTSAIKTGTGSNGVATFKTVFAVTDQAPVQAIPFSFVNLRLWSKRLKSQALTSQILTLSGSGGIGVNPNSGTKEVEFFSGVALGIGNVYFHLGAHYGEFKNLGGGFAIGETVPSGFPSSVPINKGYTIHPSFGLSYRLPLP